MVQWLKENLIRQTSFLPKNSSKKPASFRVKRLGPNPIMAGLNLVPSNQMFVDLECCLSTCAKLLFLNHILSRTSSLSLQLKKSAVMTYTNSIQWPDKVSLFPCFVFVLFLNKKRFIVTAFETSKIRYQPCRDSLP